VSDGGGLVAVCDHAGSDRNSDGVDSPKAWGRLDRLHLWGAHFDSAGEANSNFSQTSGNVDTSPTNPIIHGVNGVADSLMFAAGTSMQLYPATNPNVRGDVWMNGAAHGNTQVMAAHSTYGLGRIFFVGDSSPVDDGSAAPGNSSIYDGWADASGRDSLLIMNGTMWATRQAATDATPPTITVNAPNGGEAWGRAPRTTSPDGVRQHRRGVDQPDYSTNNGGRGPSSPPGWPTRAATPDVAGRRHDAGARAPPRWTPTTARLTRRTVFTINDQTLPLVTLLSPNGGENWAAGSLHTITWTATDNVGVASITLEFSLNNGAGYTTIASGQPNSGSYAWTLPQAVSTQALVRVKALDGAANTGSDVSNLVFTLSDQTAPVATVTSPNGGEDWAIGSVHAITWTATDNIAVNLVNLTYSIDNGATFLSIAIGLANSGSFDWTVPNAPTGQALVRVRAADGASLSPGSPCSQSPTRWAERHAAHANGGGRAPLPSDHTDGYRQCRRDAVTLDYSLDLGGTWTTIVSGLLNSGSWS
jgi:hypothetical protein